MTMTDSDTLDVVTEEITDSEGHGKLKAVLVAIGLAAAAAAVAGWFKSRRD